MVEVDIEEDEIHIKGDDGLNLRVIGRIPDRWALILIMAILGYFGFQELAI